jgi:serine/threonine-protein kinase RsbW
MMLARVDCPIDRLDDAMLLCDAISAHGTEQAADGHLSFELNTDGGGFRLRVGDLTEQGARTLLSDAVLPGVGNLLERVADAVRVEPPSGDGAEELVVELSFG